MKKIDLRTLVHISIVAALYIILTVAIMPISYGSIQFRISEVLVLLCFYKKEYAISLVLGCLVANLGSPLGLIDVFVGTMGTLLSVLCIMFSKNLFLATLYPVVFNGILVGLELVVVGSLEPFFPSLVTMSGIVMIGEFCAVSILGYAIFRILSRNKGFMDLIGANQNLGSPMQK